MSKLGRCRLKGLRAMYLFIAAGLGLSVWPGLIGAMGKTADSHTVISAFLAALTLLAVLGLAHPLKMLPILLFEVLWKGVWLLLYALPMYLDDALDAYASSVAVACLLGVVVTPLAIPWRYVVGEYLKIGRTT